MAEIITNLHPDGDVNTNLYPNIKKENIPSKSISTDKLDDNVLSLIGSLKPSGTDTSTNILAYTSNKGIYVATDNGHWYYWNGSVYVDGGVYQSSEDVKQINKKLDELGYEIKSFNLKSGVDHSSTKDQIYYDIKQGEEYYIRIDTSASDNYKYHIYIYDDSKGTLFANTFTGKDYFFTAPTSGNRIGILVQNVAQDSTNKVLLYSKNSYFGKIDSKVNVINKSLLLTKEDEQLKSGSIQTKNQNLVFDATILSAVGYKKLIELNEGERVKIEVPLIEGVHHYTYRYGYYGDGVIDSQIPRSNNNIFTQSKGYSLFAFGVYARNEDDTDSPINLYENLPYIKVEFLDRPKTEYIDIDDVIKEIDKSLNGSKTINDLNKIDDLLIQALRPVNNSSFGYKSETQPLSLLHFSDIHGDKVELQRIIDFYNNYDDKIHDIINTGDTLEFRWTSSFDFWGEVQGAEKIINVIGNHDTLKDTIGWDWNNRATEEEQYNRFISPYISNWNITNNTGKTYFYKDYASNKIRLIVLNCMLTDDDDLAQAEWFVNALNGSITNDYSVIVAQHCPLTGMTKVNCNYTSKDANTGSSYFVSDYVGMVETFINSNGKFVCWLGGHQHNDLIGIKNNQLCICVDALSRQQGDQYSDTARVDGKKSQDLANVVVIDTSSKVIKIIRVGADTNRYMLNKLCTTINYETKEVY